MRILIYDPKQKQNGQPADASQFRSECIYYKAITQKNDMPTWN